MISQCLYYALTKWRHEGGYIMFGRSTHWCVPHVLHMTNTGDITHFAPEQDLKTPWLALIGYEGIIFNKDIHMRKPMNVLCMFVGTLILLIFGCLWAIKTYVGDRMTLVENAKESWRWFSMQAMTLAVALQGTWISLPEDLKSKVPTNLVYWLTLSIVLAGIVGRLVKQGGTDAPK